MKSLIAVVWLVISASALAAEPVVVRTGEHATFTRVVLTIPPGADWRLGRDPDGYAVQLPVTDGYDVSQFFNRIPTDRIEAVAQDRSNGVLRFRVTCDCNANAFLYRSDLLVIDVLNGSPEPDSAFETPLFPDQVPSGTAFSVPQNPLLPVILPRSNDRQTPAAPVIDPSADVSSDASGDVAAPNDSLEEELATLEAAITQSLARGLSQGLLAPGGVADEEADSFEETMRAALADQGVALPGISASTSVDVNAVPPDPVVRTTQTGESCLPSDYFDVGSWGNDDPFHVQLAAARSLVTEEFDRMDETAVRDLARLYIYFGFGREAVQAMALDGVNSVERRYLTALAQIMDGDPVDQDLFTEQVSCATPAALWALLAHRGGAMDAEVDTPAVLRNFNALPPGLQSHLAPRLADRFIAIGDTYGASQVLEASRTSDLQTFDAAIAETALTRAMGEPVQAVADLAEIASNDRRMTPEAMIKLFDEALENEFALSDQDFILADALRFENARLDIAGDLAASQIRALLFMDKFAEAAALLSDETAGLGAERTAMLSEDYAAQATQRMGDADFLRFAFDPSQIGVSQNTEIAVADRLLALGFPDHAAAILTNTETAAARLLQARILLATGSPIDAIALVAEDTSPEAIALRRAAQDQLPAEMAQDLAITPDTPEAQWRQGSWDALTQSDDPLLQAASTTILEEDPNSLDPDAPLASGEALLDASAQSRALLDELLNRFAAPADF